MSNETTQPNNPAPDAVEAEGVDVTAETDPAPAVDVASALEAIKEEKRADSKQETDEQTIAKVVSGLAAKAMSITRRVEEAPCFEQTHDELDGIVTKAKLPPEWVARVVLYMVPPKWEDGLRAMMDGMSRNQLVILAALVPSIWMMGFRRGRRTS